MNLSVSPRPVSQPAQRIASESVPSPYGPYERGTSGHASDSVRLFYDQEQRHEIIAQAAYFRAKHRGFASGHELDDWLAAEAEVDSELTAGPRP